MSSRGTTASIALGLLIAASALGQNSPAEWYQASCAACHGSDGRGRSQEQLAFEPLPPDFSDCEFASREPDPDWFAVIHQGGPIRVFDSMMPAFGDALSDDEIQLILDHVRTFCTDKRWPRGELNMPRGLFTEKAFPEDEAAVTGAVAEAGNGVELEFLYEKRFGPQTQIEISLPLLSLDTVSSGRETRLGDLALGIKQNLHHNLERGSIFSVGAEVVLPTGNDTLGFGKGTTILEPYVAYGQMLPSEMFLHVQALGEFASDGNVEDELALRAAFGRTWAVGERGFGRAWTPMLEVLAAKGQNSGSNTNLDLVPQFQVTLNTRQHVIFNFGVRLPVSNTAGRDTEFLFYFLWDWFDGGLRDGW